GFDTMFEDKTTVGASLQLKTNFFGMKGHQYFGAINGFGDYDEQTEDFRLFLPASATGFEAEQVNGTWTLFYNFDQQLIADPNNPERDIGVFGRFGIADKKSSVIRSFWSFGLGGNGLFPSRVQDGFGLGYYYMDFSSDRVRQIVPDGHEQGVEAFYNLAVTPALGITADLQVIDGALSGSDTAAVAGLRARVSF
ncbi:MAG: carbohydrate porin, partial [Geminicoccaceae bacterium]